MLHRLRPRQAPERPREPALALLECHERIRSFLAIASRLATATEAPAAEVAEAAARLSRYFGEALPLHEQDEELSVAQRLSGADARLTGVLATMAAQHAETHAVLASLQPEWERIAREPERIGDASPLLERQTERLRWLLEGHLEMEELEIIPRIARLHEAERHAILDEIRARRSGP